MATNDITNIAGALVFWNFGPGTELYKLRNALEDNGFYHYSPERMTDAAALKASLAKEFPGDKIFTVDVDGLAVFEIVKIVKKDRERNTYEHILTASVNSRQEIDYDLPDHDRDQRIKEQFRGYTTLVPTSQLTAVMVEIVASLGGLSMRPAGGVYWIPETNWQRWKALADSIETTGPKNRLDACRVILDQHCIKSVQEALTNEIDREAKLIQETINDQDKGKRATNSARKRAEALRDKVSEYERAFSIPLAELTKRLDEATTIEATASLVECSLFD